MLPAVVLVRPIYSGNIGSVARAMKNMGLKQLLLVEPKGSVADQEAYNMATYGRDLLKKAKAFPNLTAALKGFDWVIGTSRRRGGERANWRHPREMVAELLQESKQSKVAWVFGPEDSGLSNDDIQLCHRLVQIPSDPKCASLNLAQAVMVLAYEWYDGNLEKKYRRGKSAAEKTQAQLASGAFPKAAKVQSLEAMYADLQLLLGEIGFLNKENPTHLIKIVRNFFNRARPSEKEVRIVRGICRQVRWFGSDK